MLNKLPTRHAIVATTDWVADPVAQGAPARLWFCWHSTSIVGFNDVNLRQGPDPSCWYNSNLHWAGKLFTAVKFALWQCVGENSKGAECSMEALQQPKHSRPYVLDE
ncbi:hypothetical protein HAX54_036485 [Datura stramonium]|uniref:Uncharacterized protein n=1 Tax=Datura stramonium TaxID=4076 RepID=A0ABS8SG44_DATST|nr:hypothetical protein [Datura stramonium]